ncbi:hypothetical protein [Microbacterium oleivorans]|uniref:DUF3137 domain-containing protein n=1 Tax=Microbacterium oleivorans TaxID=273677 RepID=A0A7D5IXZ8_9MICO|nr:hypothetical protein [Microbacterium oleivorans]QLD11956.1 hypothetical protein HW566_09365 [Microbacterium oleivorans]
MSVPFDPRPLQEPISPATARAFRKHLGQTGRLPGGAGTAAGVIVAIVVVIFIVLVFGGVLSAVIGGLIVAAGAQSGTGAALSLTTLIPLVILIGLAALIPFFVRRQRTAQAAAWYRLDRFAQANGMSFEPQRPNPPLPGMIFSQGSSRMASNLVRGDRPRFVEFANYRYTTGSGKNQQTHTWGYVAVHLSTPLPHIVLDAVGNNGLFGSNLPVAFDRDQHLSLEGDFDRYFRLYCPRGYERDALYLFTPDIMARFVDNAAALDVEIVDDWLFFYGKRDFSTLDPATWSWLFGAVAAMIDKFAQWERWRDDRLGQVATSVDAPTSPLGPVPGSPAAGAPGSPATPGSPALGGPSAPAPGDPAALPVAPPPGLLRPPPGVAAPGQRLRRGVPWVAVVIVVVVVLAGVIGPAIAFIGGLLAAMR